LFRQLAFIRAELALRHQVLCMSFIRTMDVSHEVVSSRFEPSGLRSQTAPSLRARNRPRGTADRTPARRYFESRCGTWGPVLWLRLYNPRSRVAVGVTHKRTLTITSRSIILHFCGYVTIAGKELRNLGLCPSLKAFEPGGIFIVPHML
jgi:hypothetical protein